MESTGDYMVSNATLLQCNVAIILFKLTRTIDQ